MNNCKIIFSIEKRPNPKKESEKNEGINQNKSDVRKIKEEDSTQNDNKENINKEGKNNSENKITSIDTSSNKHSISQNKSKKSKKTIHFEGKILRPSTNLYKKNISKIKELMNSKTKRKKRERKRFCKIRIKSEKKNGIIEEKLDDPKNKMNNNYLNEYENNKNIDREMYLEFLKFRSKKIDYMSKFEILNIEKRGILISWIQSCCQNLGLSRNTFYLSVEIIDIYLSITKDEIDLDKLKLIGVTCLFIAHKMEDVIIFKAKYFCILSNTIYSKQLIINKESDILRDLKFHLNFPTLLNWINFHTSLWDSLIDYLKYFDFNYPKFRNDTSFGDQLLFKLYLITDSICLDYQFIFLEYKYLSLACLILIIGQAQNIFNEEIFENIIEYTNNFPSINKFIQDILKIMNQYLFLDNIDCMNYYLIYVSNFMKIKFNYSLIINNNFENYPQFDIKEVKRNFQSYYKENFTIINEILKNNVQE